MKLSASSTLWVVCSPFRRPFQLGYVTADLEAAVAAMRAEQGVELANFGVVTLDLIDGDHIDIKVALGYARDVMIELIEPVGDIPLYAGHLPDRSGPSRLHHIGYSVEDADELNDVVAAHRRLGHEVALNARLGDARYTYVDTLAKLGHFQEYLLVDSAGRAWQESLPRNT